jgi:hypothetical protein
VKVLDASSVFVNKQTDGRTDRLVFESAQICRLIADETRGRKVMQLKETKIRKIHLQETMSSFLFITRK